MEQFVMVVNVTNTVIVVPGLMVEVSMIKVRNRNFNILLLIIYKVRSGIMLRSEQYLRNFYGKTFNTPKKSDVYNP